jgi:hypothetical protein
MTSPDVEMKSQEEIDASSGEKEQIMVEFTSETGQTSIL